MKQKKEEKKAFMFGIKEDEFNWLRNGNQVNRIFQFDSLCPTPLLMVSISKKKLTKEDFKAIIENGDSATGIKITDKQIDILEEGKQAIRTTYKDFDVVLYSESKFKQYEKAKQKSQNKVYT